MLFYTDFCVTHGEVPGESTLCIYISGCQYHCKDCHNPELQRANYGEILSERYYTMLDLYGSQITCICFLGEGESTPKTQKELTSYVAINKKRGYKSCLYSGKDTGFEEWMVIFDYVKLGSFQRDLGPLTSPTTNQRMLQKTETGYKDVTFRFWQ